jgi:hypothetical protein
MASWRIVLLVDEIGIPGEHHRPAELTTLAVICSHRVFLLLSINAFLFPEYFRIDVTLTVLDSMQLLRQFVHTDKGLDIYF